MKTSFTVYNDGHWSAELIPESEAEKQIVEFINIQPNKKITGKMIGGAMVLQGASSVGYSASTVLHLEVKESE